MKTAKPITYFLYARKSTESEDRQMLSIESQIHELRRIAEREGLVIADTLQESRSAKSLGRPIFHEMLERISRGEANGILCWKLDRLARNFIDGGRIIEMLQTGSIKHIRAFEHSYYPQDNVLLMAVELGMANQFSRDLAVNVKRGMRRKAEMGWYPVQPPLGYLNTKNSGKGSNTIIKDTERFDLVRRIWDTMLTGAYTPPKVLELATKEWGLCTRRGMKLSRSNIYVLLSNPFYYGMFVWEGVWYQGVHEAMITVDEYDRVQAILGSRGRPRPKSHIYAFAGTMRCGECGMAITAEEKVKTQKNGNVHRYRYYHCTKKSTKIKCAQSSIEEGAILEQGVQKLDELVIPDQFFAWALKWLAQENDHEISSRNTILATQRKAYDEVVRKIDRYIEMRAKNELTEEEYAERRGAVLKEKARLMELINGTDGRVTRWAENMSCAFEFVARAKEEFVHGTPEQRRIILLALGSNLTLLDKMISIDTEKTLLPVKRIAREIQSIHKPLEPVQNGSKQEYFEHIYAHSPIVSALMDEARTVFMQEPTPSYVSIVKRWRIDRKYPGRF